MFASIHSQKPAGTHKHRVLLVLVVVSALVLILVGFGVQTARKQAEDTNCRSKAYFWAQLLHDYAAYYGCWPPPFISDEDRRPLYSWRVLLLPSIAGAPGYDEFDFTKPWNDPANMRAVQGKHASQLKKMFSCPATDHTNAQTDFFYALNIHDRWPRDFFYDPNAPAFVLLVETQARDVDWSEPVDFEYAEPGLDGLLRKIRQSTTVHHSGFACVGSQGPSLRIPRISNAEFDLAISKLSTRTPRIGKQARKEEIDRLVSRLVSILSSREPQGTFYNRHMAMLLLGELGQEAKASIPAIQETLKDERNVRLTNLAEFALRKIKTERQPD